MIHNKRSKSTARIPEKHKGFSSEEPSIDCPAGAGSENKSLNTVE